VHEETAGETPALPASRCWSQPASRSPKGELERHRLEILRLRTNVITPSTRADPTRHFAGQEKPLSWRSATRRAPTRRHDTGGCSRDFIVAGLQVVLKSLQLGRNRSLLL
jgi:hypothetical protein